MAEGAALRAVRGCLAAFPREARGERGARREVGGRGGLEWLTGAFLGDFPLHKVAKHRSVFRKPSFFFAVSALLAAVARFGSPRGAAFVGRRPSARGPPGARVICSHIRAFEQSDCAARFWWLGVGS